MLFYTYEDLNPTVRLLIRGPKDYQIIDKYYCLFSTTRGTLALLIFIAFVFNFPEIVNILICFQVNLKESTNV